MDKLISELLILPEKVRNGDFVLNLSKGVTEPEKTLDENVVTPQLVASFDDALDFMNGTPTKDEGGRMRDENLDELILWLATHSADLGFVQTEGNKLAKLVESRKSERPVPIISFVARQRDLRDLIGKNVTGVEQLNFSVFKMVYPFSPAMIQALVAVSSALQRERTSLKIMLQLFVNRRDTLRLGDVIPLGDLWDVVAHGDEALKESDRGRQQPSSVDRS